MSGRNLVVEVMDDDVAEMLRRKTPAERLEIAFGMWQSARDMLTAMLTSQHPNWSTEQITAELVRRLRETHP